MKRVSVSLVLAAVSGCQLWLEVDPPQCKSDRACVALLGDGYTCSNAGVCVPPKSENDDAGMNLPPLDVRWQCIREKPKEIVVDPEKKVTLRMDVVDISTMRVPEGLVANACTTGDVECQNPEAANVTPGDDGYMEFELPHGFKGFVQIHAPNYVPSISYDNKPYTANLMTSGPAIITPGVLSVISAGSGVESKPNTGLVFLDVRDCADGAGEGVSFEPVEDIDPFYFDGPLPSRTLTETVQTDQLSADREKRAVAGFSNMEPGYKTFEAKLASTGDVVGRVTVMLRANEITYVRLRAGY